MRPVTPTPGWGRARHSRLGTEIPLLSWRGDLARHRRHAGHQAAALPLTPRAAVSTNSGFLPSVTARNTSQGPTGKKALQRSGHQERICWLLSYLRSVWQTRVQINPEERRSSDPGLERRTEPRGSSIQPPHALLLMRTYQPQAVGVLLPWLRGAELKAARSHPEGGKRATGSLAGAGGEAERSWAWSRSPEPGEDAPSCASERPRAKLPGRSPCRKGRVKRLPLPPRYPAQDRFDATAGTP